MHGRGEVMTLKVNVTSCTPRRDGQYMVAYKDARGTGYAVSEHPVPEGKDVRIRDGRVIR